MFADFRFLGIEITESSTACRDHNVTFYDPFYDWVHITFTTMPPDEPPQAANEPIGVKLARSFRSIMIGCPFSSLF